MPYKDKEKEREYKKRYNYSKNKRCPNCGKLICNISNKCNGCAKKGENNPMKNPKVAKKCGEARKGKKCLWLLGDKNPFYGKHHTKESKKKISENHADFSGKNHPNWQGGLKKLPYAPDWGPKVKEKVFERDDYICQNCGATKDLMPHHINYDKMNCDSTNLITLCSQCNTRANYDRKKWQLLYENQM